MTQRLFVYGTLRPGRTNEYILSNIGGTWKKASVKGHLIMQGWGAEMGCPGIRLAINGKLVEGYIFTSDKLNDHWGELDEFEGEGYTRLLTRVTTSDGEKVEAFIYVLNEGSSVPAS